MLHEDQSATSPASQIPSRHLPEGGMDIQQPVDVLRHTPFSSPHLSCSHSGSSNSIGSSSLDTASASAHLERYETPWTLGDVNIFRGFVPRRTRSYNAFLEWHSTAIGARRLLRHSRPLAGTSRKRLIRQIQQLTKDKAELEAQLASIVSSAASSNATGSSAAKSPRRVGAGSLPLEHATSGSVMAMVASAAEASARAGHSRSQATTDAVSSINTADTTNTTSTTPSSPTPSSSARA